MGVHRVTELEHHVVRDVDSRRDRPDAAQQQPRRIHHGDSACWSIPVTGRSANRLTPVPGSTVSGQRSPSSGQRRDIGGVDEVQVVGARDLTRHAAHRQAVAAVRCDRQVEHHVVEPETSTPASPGSAVPGGNTMMPEWSEPKPEFGRRADHAVGGPAVGLARRDVKSPGSAVPRQSHHHQIADGEIRCPTDDVAWLPLADVDLAGPDGLLELGEFLDLGDPADGQRPVTGPSGMTSSTSWPIRINAASRSSGDTSQSGAPD